MADEKRSFNREGLDDEIEQLLRIEDPGDLAKQPDARLVDDLRHAHQTDEADAQSLARVYMRLQAHKRQMRATSRTAAGDPLPISPSLQKGWHSVKSSTESRDTIPANRSARSSRSRLATGVGVVLVIALLVGAIWVFNGMRARPTAGNSGSPQPGSTAPQHSIHTGKQLCSVSIDKNYALMFARPQMSWSSAGVLAEAHPQVKVFDPQTCAAKSVNWPANSMGHPVWSPDGKRLLLMHGSTAQVLDASTGQTVATLRAQKSQSASFDHAAWMPNGAQIVTVTLISYDTHTTSTVAIQAWDASTGALVRTVKTASVLTASATVAPNGKYFALGTPDKHIQFWDVATGQMVSSVSAGRSGLAESVWSPDGAYLAFAEPNPNWPASPTEVQVYATANAQHVASFQDSDTFEGNIDALAWSPDGKYLAESSHEIHIWDVTTQKLAATFGKIAPETTASGGSKTFYEIAGLAWSPDGDMLASVTGSIPWNPAGGVPDQTDTLNVWKLS